MFASSTQLKFWTFSGTTELNRLRSEANHAFVSANCDDQEDEYKDEFFLTVAEEARTRRHYEYVLRDLCLKFKPSMPKYVMGTAMVYLKRFYLYSSVMDYHPDDILYTCIYLACKVEEFNLSIAQFVANLKGDRDRAVDIILSQELVIMHKLQYHLTVHNPFRPLEGLFIDIKTRCPDVAEPERIRPGAEDFIMKSYHTDVCLIFAPSQIALAAILKSASKLSINLDSYVANKLLSSGNQENLMKTVEIMKRIRYMLTNMDQLDRNEVVQLLEKLDRCRNQENNPASEIYQHQLQELLDEEEQGQITKNERRVQETNLAVKEILGI